MPTFPDLCTLDHWQKAVDADAQTLTLPVRGREYTWKSSGLLMRSMLQLRQLDEQTRTIAAKLAAGTAIDPADVVLSDTDEQQLGEDLIGADNLAQMADDGVTWAEVQHVVMVLMAWYLHGEEAARGLWSSQFPGAGK